MKPFPVAVIEAVLAAGVEEFVVCAGARNSALIVVLAALGEKVRVWQHFDERAAGFFAIGRIRATEKPVAVVTTSGTAAAELLPAVIEAHYQGLPLVAITADRPWRYRGTGAPQAINQLQLFGDYAISLDEDGTGKEWDWSELLEAANWNALLPLHLNACFEEPDPSEWPEIRQASAGLSPASFARLGANKTSYSPQPLACGRALVVGELLDSEIPPVAEVALAAGAVIYAEAASGLRDRTELQDRLIRCGDAMLGRCQSIRMLRLGGVPSVRFWRDIEAKEWTVASCSRSGYSGLPQGTVLHRLEDVMEFVRNGPASGHAESMFARDAALYARLGELLIQFPASEPALFRRLSQIIPENAAVLTGNSLAIREWNLCAEYGRGHRVHVLRGANGIDGNLSAFLGVAAEEPEAWCVTGDLTTLYDLNAPWMLPQLCAGRRRFVVIQNAGGKIFSRLPSLRGLTERERSLMENPHMVSLRGWAEMWGMDHAAGRAEILERTDALADHAVVELHPDAAQTEEFWKAWARAESEVWNAT